MIQPKYDINDKVFCARVSWTATKVQCPDCLGTQEWHVILPSGEEFQHDCNTCCAGWYSTGEVSEWGDHIHIDQYTIGSVRIDTGDKERPISYMCTETGVGSGSFYDESEMFRTLEEAQAWGELELVRVKGLRQAEELKLRELKKMDLLVHGKRKKKS